MNKNIIAEFEKKDIFARMDIHNNLSATNDVEMIKTYFSDFGIKNVTIAQAIAFNNNTPSDILLELVKEDRYLKNVLSNPNTPMDVLLPYAVLQEHGSFKNKMSILANPNVSNELLEILSKDELGMVFWEARHIQEKRLQTNSAKI